MFQCNVPISHITCEIHDMTLDKQTYDTIPIHDTYTQCLYTIPIHNTYTQYLYTIPIHNTYTQYLYTIPIHNTYTQYLYTIHNTYTQYLYMIPICTQYLYTMPIHNTQYLYTIPIHDTYTQYLYTIPIHNAYTQYLYMIPICTQYLYTMPIHDTQCPETMPVREIKPLTTLTRIRSQFHRTQWSTSNHQRVNTTTPQTAQPSGAGTSLPWKHTDLLSMETWSRQQQIQQIAAPSGGQWWGCGVGTGGHLGRHGNRLVLFDPVRGQILMNYCCRCCCCIRNQHYLLCDEQNLKKFNVYLHNPTNVLPAFLNHINK